MIKRLRVLFVDDSKSILLWEDKIKKNENLIVNVVATLDALYKEHNNYDIIILDMDINNEKNAGLEALTKLTNLKTKAKILINSYFVNKPLIEQAKKNGAIGYIYKNDFNPINDIEDVLNDILNGTTKTFINWSSDSVRDIDIMQEKDVQGNLKAYELEILRLKAAGNSSSLVAKKIKEIYKLDIHIDKFLDQIAKAWGIKNDKAAIVAKAILDGVIEKKDIIFKKQ